MIITSVIMQDAVLNLEGIFHSDNTPKYIALAFDADRRIICIEPMFCITTNGQPLARMYTTSITTSMIRWKQFCSCFGLTPNIGARRKCLLKAGIFYFGLDEELYYLPCDAHFTPFSLDVVVKSTDSNFISLQNRGVCRLGSSIIDSLELSDNLKYLQCVFDKTSCSLELGTGLYSKDIAPITWLSSSRSLLVKIPFLATYQGTTIRLPCKVKIKSLMIDMTAVKKYTHDPITHTRVRHDSPCSSLNKHSNVDRIQNISFPKLFCEGNSPETISITLDDTFVRTIQRYPAQQTGVCQSLFKIIQQNLSRNSLGLSRLHWESVFKRSFSRDSGSYQQIFQQLISSLVQECFALIQEESWSVLSNAPWCTRPSHIEAQKKVSPTSIQSLSRHIQHRTDSLKQATDAQSNNEIDSETYLNLFSENAIPEPIHITIDATTYNEILTFPSDKTAGCGPLFRIIQQSLFRKSLRLSKLHWENIYKRSLSKQSKPHTVLFQKLISFLVHQKAEFVNVKACGNILGLQGREMNHTGEALDEASNRQSQVQSQIQRIPSDRSDMVPSFQLPRLVSNTPPRLENVDGLFWKVIHPSGEVIFQTNNDQLAFIRWREEMIKFDHQVIFDIEEFQPGFYRLIDTRSGQIHLQSTNFGTMLQHARQLSSDSPSDTRIHARCVDTLTSVLPFDLAQKLSTLQPTSYFAYNRLIHDIQNSLNGRNLRLTSVLANDLKNFLNDHGRSELLRSLWDLAMETGIIPKIAADSSADTELVRQLIDRDRHICHADSFWWISYDDLLDAYLRSTHTSRSDLEQLTHKKNALDHCIQFLRSSVIRSGEHLISLALDQIRRSPLPDAVSLFMKEAPKPMNAREIQNTLSNLMNQNIKASDLHQALHEAKDLIPWDGEGAYIHTQKITLPVSALQELKHSILEDLREHDLPLVTIRSYYSQVQNLCEEHGIRSPQVLYRLLERQASELVFPGYPQIRLATRTR